MIPIVSNETMRFLDEYTINNIGVAGIVLMENAGKASADIILKILEEKAFKKIAIFAGKGNNGGDGFVISRYLFLKNIEHDLFLMDGSDNYKGDAKKNLDILIKLGQKLSFYSDIDFKLKYDLVIDALFGTGFRGDIGKPYSSVIKFMNGANKIVAIDIPSGINGDTGEGNIYVQADITLTMAFSKLGFYQNEGINACGDIKVVDISIPEKIAAENTDVFLSECSDFSGIFLEKNKIDKHKGDNGHLIIIAGSKGLSGAAIMCSKSAYKMGAGLISTILPESINIPFESNCIEPMSFPVKDNDGVISLKEKDRILGFIEKKATALIIGPGLGVSEELKELIVFLLENIGEKIPILIDADGLNNLSDMELPELKNIIDKKNIVLTPHPGEFFKLFKRKVNKRIADFREIMNVFKNVNILLKGKYTLLKKDRVKVLINSTGNANLAKGGSGDILSGIIGALIAKKIPLELAIQFGVYLHGYVADLAYEKTGDFSLDMDIFLDYIPIAIEKIKNKIFKESKHNA